MKEWICEEVPAVTIDGKVVSTMLHQEQELIRCKNCKYGHEFQTGLYSCDRNRGRNTILYRFEDWYCADAERKNDG